MEPNESNKTLALLVITSVSKMETIPNRCAAPYGVYIHLEVWLSIQTGF